jgi:restriction system protein
MATYKQQISQIKDEQDAFLQAQEIRRGEVDSHNAQLAAIAQGYADNEHEAVVWYHKNLIDRGLSEEWDATSAEVGYSPESKQIVVDLELPPLSCIPEEASYKYVKSTDRIETSVRPASKRKSLYSHLISQVALKCIDTVFRGSRAYPTAETLVLNGMLDAIDPQTGQDVRVCLLSVRLTRSGFQNLNLRQVQPEQCLKALKASISRAPSELIPVKPLLELDMVDPRFVDTRDVLSGLDTRPNLMDLTPGEFEGLITQLFSAMGLDTRQTRPSRDGGVDCVAFDPRPIFGGKVVIQAKRYKHTVGVSAVRDLFGTVQNEGASKGILVTTSGFGTASFDFAKGKPLELLDGQNLLYLLSQHAGLDARIIVPDGWADRPIHGD